jgi:hypothetical protein
MCDWSKPSRKRIELPSLHSFSWWIAFSFSFGGPLCEFSDKQWLVMTRTIRGFCSLLCWIVHFDWQFENVDYTTNSFPSDHRGMERKKWPSARRFVSCNIFVMSWWDFGCCEKCSDCTGRFIDCTRSYDSWEDEICSDSGISRRLFLDGELQFIDCNWNCREQITAEPSFVCVRHFQSQLREKTRVAQFIVDSVLVICYVSLTKHRSSRSKTWLHLARLGFKCLVMWFRAQSLPWRVILYFTSLSNPHLHIRWTSIDSHYLESEGDNNQYSLECNIFSFALILSEFMVRKSSFPKNLKQ